MPIISTPDHVAVAVPTIDVAARRWRDRLGGTWCYPAYDRNSDFTARQLHYRNGARLELLEPAGQDGFAAGFLQRYGARIHHVTLMVPSLRPAIREVRAAGYDVVDVNTHGDIWHEAFLRPSQVGGIIVQLAWWGMDDERWRAAVGTGEPQPADGAALLGPTLFHPDLDACARVWAAVGGDVSSTSESIEVSWPDAPLTVRVERGERARHPVLRMTGADVVAEDPALGPATIRDE